MALQVESLAMLLMLVLLNHLASSLMETAFVLCDTAEASILLLTGTVGMKHFLLSLRNLYDAFEIHTKVSCSIQKALQYLADIKHFHKEAKTAVISKRNLKTKSPQGPEGCVSSVFTESIDMLIECIESLQHYPALKDVQLLPPRLMRISSHW